MRTTEYMELEIPKAKYRVIHTYNLIRIVNDAERNMADSIL